MSQLATSTLAQTLQNHPAVWNFSVNPFVFQDGLNVQIGVFEGDVTQVICDAYVAPHARNRPYFGGVNKAMIKGGAERWFRDYASYVEDLNGNQMPFDTFVQRERGAQSLINVVAGESVEKSTGPLFKTSCESVFGATVKALVSADRLGFNSILLPPIGVNEMGGLSSRKSAEMIIGAITIYGKDEMVERPNEILIGIHRDSDTSEGKSYRDDLVVETYDVFREVLQRYARSNNSSKGMAYTPALQV